MKIRDLLIVSNRCSKYLHIFTHLGAQVHENLLQTNYLNSSFSSILIRINKPQVLRTWGLFLWRFSTRMSYMQPSHGCKKWR